MVIRTWPGMDLTGNLFEERERERIIGAPAESQNKAKCSVCAAVSCGAQLYCFCSETY